jgi:hypothetical protein
METFFKIYIACWATACLIALVAFVRAPSKFRIGQRAYWHFLTEPWKLVTFLISGAVVTFIAPYTGDPTWDRIDGFFMSVFCYATAPWVVAVLYEFARRKASWIELYVAVIAWMFSASWSYDIYLVWRDGDYPITWAPNIVASGVIYLSAGLFWNLEWVKGRGVIFSFMREGWPSRPAAFSPWRVALPALIFAIPVIAAILMFMI